MTEDNEVPDVFREGMKGSLQEAVASLARAVCKYYDALREEGFDDGQAMSLTIAYQISLLEQE